MRISTEVVRKLAKLDPALREVFYSFLDEIEGEEESALLTNKIENMVREIDSFREEIRSEMVSFQEEILSALKLLHSRLEVLGDKVKEVSDKQGKISAKVESLSRKQDNKETENIRSQMEKAISHFKDTVEEKFEGIRQEIDKIKERLGAKERIGIFKNLSKVLKKKLSLNLKEHIRSKKIKREGQEIFFDIFASGTKNKKKCALVGKVVDKPGKEEIDALSREVDVLIEDKILPQNVVKLLVVEEITEDMEKFATKQGVFILWNQDL